MNLGNMFSQFLLGLQSYISAFALIVRYRLWSYVIISGIISFTIGAIVIYTAYICSGIIGAFLIDFYPYDFGKSIVESIASTATGLLLIAISFFLYKYIILIVLSPLMGPLSERVEKEMTGFVNTSFGVKIILNGIWRGLRISLRNLTKEVYYSALLLIASFIPGVNIITAPMLFLVQAYYVGFGNMDYYSERHYTVRQSAQFVKANKFYAIGNGVAFLGLISIPFVGLFLAPSLATIAATSTIISSDKISHLD